MNWILKSAVIVDPNGPFHLQSKDLLISNGRITKIADEINEEANIFEAHNLHVSAGWFDMRVHFCDPGYEHREDIESGLRAAQKGGFTGVALSPDTLPPLSNKSQINYAKERAEKALVDLFPYGTISAERQGKELAELYDMYRSGAVAFTDAKHPVADASLMSTALQYAQNIGALIMSFPHEQALAQNGQMHEGDVSTRLGLTGIPALAEELLVSRDLYLAEYNGAPIHFSGLSTAGSVALIREARKKGIKVTADVCAHQLLLTDEDLSDFGQQFKVLPPLRDESHRLALIEGLKDGTIDAICSDHTPEDVERKNVEFDLAAFGAIGLESAFGVLQKSLDGHLELADIIGKISHNPRKILGLEPILIEEGTNANLTLFDPDAEWTFTLQDILSKSKNSPFIGTQLKGKALAVCNNGQLERC